MLEIEKVSAKYAKYANNTEFAGDKFTTGWTLPLDMHLTCEQFEEAFDKKYFTRALFEDKKGTKYSLWKGMQDGLFKMGTEFKNAGFLMVFTGGKKVEWEADCNVTSIQYEPVDAGTIHLKCNVYVHPNAEQKRLLEQFQHSDVTVTLGGAEVKAKVSDKQQEMFTASDGKPPETAPNYTTGSTLENGDGTKTELRSGAEIDAEMRGREAGSNAKAAKAQVAAFKRGKKTANTTAADKH